MAGTDIGSCLSIEQIRSQVKGAIPTIADAFGPGENCRIVTEGNKPECTKRIKAFVSSLLISPTITTSCDWRTWSITQRTHVYDDGD